MRIYVLCDIYIDYGQYDQDVMIEKFRDVATNEKVVVVWAKQIIKDNLLLYVTCRVYDDVGIHVGEVDLEATAKQGKVVLLSQVINAD